MIVFLTVNFSTEIRIIFNTRNLEAGEEDYSSLTVRLRGSSYYKSKNPRKIPTISGKVIISETSPNHTTNVNCEARKDDCES